LRPDNRGKPFRIIYEDRKQRVANWLGMTWYGYLVEGLDMQNIQRGGRRALVYQIAKTLPFSSKDVAPMLPKIHKSLLAHAVQYLA